MTFETALELAAIADDDNRRGEPTEGLVPEQAIWIPTHIADDDDQGDAPEWWTLGGILES